jgi:hypothetical protein
MGYGLNRLKEQEKSENDTAEAAGEAVPETPRYEKPRLRRYDQIDQVRPYGPSEI